MDISVAGVKRARLEAEPTTTFFEVALVLLGGIIGQNRKRLREKASSLDESVKQMMQDR